MTASKGRLSARRVENICYIAVDVQWQSFDARPFQVWLQHAIRHPALETGRRKQQSTRDAKRLRTRSTGLPTAFAWSSIAPTRSPLFCEPAVRNIARISSVKLTPSPSNGGAPNTHRGEVKMHRQYGGDTWTSRRSSRKQSKAVGERHGETKKQKARSP